MATILFQAAGAAVGSVFGPVGAMLGRAAGALAGSAVDKALIGGGKTAAGTHLSSARIPGADEGSGVNRLYGTARLGGTLIWATRFEEQVSVQRSGSKATGTRVETFRYFANFAIGLCEGPIACIRRAWADGNEIDLTQVEMRVYDGSETQSPDPLIEARQGSGNAPAYRGLAYVVFERLPLDDYGNRIPLLQFEVVRPIGRLENQIRAVTIIPGSTEHGYGTVRVTERTSAGSARALNRNVLTATTDWQASIDELTAICPNLERVALVVSWFGTDLRAGSCRIAPGVETAVRQRESSAWSVSGMARDQAHLVSTSNGGPAFGGTPDDASVLQAIADLKARGLSVCLYPFLMMDIPAGNGLADPEGAAEQPAYPWRGRIGAFPAIGRPGTADRTATARTQVGLFRGSARPGDFTVTDHGVAYHGSDEGYRRMVLHYAHLATVAGGVDGFIIGSELRGLTTLRDETGHFPFVEALVALAADVRSILGPETGITYAADWSEYFGYHPDDGSGDVLFHLDPLWAAPAIDAIGIDNYMPLSDWRDEDLSAPSPDGSRTQDDLAALTLAISGGEGYDWYYASAAGRQSRNRLPISDGLAGKPWVFRYKDIASWWSNHHYDRIGGAEVSTPTAWVPASKPVWFTEIGCPAIDKGANQPNVFLDPKSVESMAPYFSNRLAADSVQRRFLEAHHDHWAASAMVDPGRLFVWTWDARPFPAFPQEGDVWSDGANWRTGHWLNGRLGAGILADVIAAILRERGFADFDVSEVSGDLPGYVQGAVASARDLLDPLLEAFQIDVVEDGPVLRFRSRTKASRPPLVVDAVADGEGQPLWQEILGHDSDFAAEAIVTFYDPLNDYEQASVRSRRAPSASSRVLRYDLGIVLPEETALCTAESLLRDNRISRRSLTFSLSPAEVLLQPGDVVSMGDGPEGRFLVTRIEDGTARRIEAREFAPDVGGSPAGSLAAASSGGSRMAAAIYAPLVALMDLPRYATGEAADFARAAVFARPWRTTALLSSPSTEAYEARARFDRPARIGTLAAPLLPGVSGRFNWSATLDVDLLNGGLDSAQELLVLNGANLFAIKAGDGRWEVGAFLQAEEIASSRWRLGGLLRGLYGTEDVMAAGAAAGAMFVMLDEAVKPLALSAGEIGMRLNWIAEASGATDSAGPFIFEGGVRAETPLSPVHLSGFRNGGGNAVLTWVRRGRMDADSWQPADIPLDEPAERYRLDVMHDGAIVRSVEVGEPTWIYPSADEIADFGGLQPQLEVSVSQLGQRVPEGISAVALITF